MHRLLPLAVVAMVFSATTLLAMEELRWGGPGHDPALKTSHRFVARRGGHARATATLEIRVDSRETVHEVGRMRLITADRQELSSIRCWKAMRHISAPWACSFQLEPIKQFSGRGRIIVTDRSGDRLMEDTIDLDRLSGFAATVHQTH